MILHSYYKYIHVFSFFVSHDENVAVEENCETCFGEGHLIGALLPWSAGAGL